MGLDRDVWCGSLMGSPTQRFPNAASIKYIGATVQKNSHDIYFSFSADFKLHLPQTKWTLDTKPMPQITYFLSVSLNAAHLLCGALISSWPV